MSLNRPNPFLYLWAENGKRFDVHDSVSDTANGKANIQTGFPEITMKSVLKGGVPPWGQDLNGILHRLSQANQWTQAGGLPQFNHNLCTQKGGYAVGAILQTVDKSKPWVLWMNLQDGNMFNPDLNAINKVGEQNGWIRFPVISSDEGNIQYYDEDGKSIAASPSVSTFAYVSKSKGSDETGRGIRDNPYRTIYKAIRELPSAGSAIIYLMAEDVHECDAYVSDGRLMQYIGLSSMHITFIPYSDNSVTQTIQDNAVNFFQQKVVDGRYGYCIANLQRPTLRLKWSRFETGQQYFCGFNGTAGAFSIDFLGIIVDIEDVDGLSQITTNMASSWLWNGGIYTFCGCVFMKMPYKTANSGFNFLQGWSGSIGNTQAIFSYRNYFEDGVHSQSLFFATPRNNIVNANDEVLDASLMGDYTFIQSNAVAFLSRNIVFNNSVSYVYNPSKAYLNLTTNFSISGVA